MSQTGARELPDSVLGALGVVSALAVWELLPRVGAVNANFLPPASVALGRLAELVRSETLWLNVGLTLRGWAIGLVIAMTAGIILGLVIGSSALLRQLTASTIEFLRPIPSVALIPLVVLLFGSRPASALVLVSYAAFWQVLVQLLNGVADVDPIALETARSFRLSRRAVTRSVLWPSTLPYLFTGWRLAATVALILQVTAELVIGVPGIGREIAIAQSSGAVADTYALVIVVGFIGLGVNVITWRVSRRVLRWHPSARGET